MQMLIGGRWVEKDETIPVKNPFDESIIDEVPRAEPEDVEDAFASALRGLEQMSKLSAHERYKILRRTAEAIETRAEELAKTLASEVGKTIREARGEVSRTAQTFTFGAEDAKRIYGEGKINEFCIKEYGNEENTCVYCSITDCRTGLSQRKHRMDLNLQCGPGV